MLKYKKRNGPPGPHVWSIKHNLSKWKCPLPYPTQNDQVHQKVCHKAWVWQSPKQIQPDKNSTKMSTFVKKTEIPDKKKVYPSQPLSSAHGAICCPPLDRLVARLYVGISLDLKPLKSCWPVGQWWCLFPQWYAEKPFPILGQSTVGWWVKNLPSPPLGFWQLAATELLSYFFWIWIIQQTFILPLKIITSYPSLIWSKPIIDTFISQWL